MRPMTLGLLIVLAGLLLFSWFISTHERVREDVYVGYKGEAVYNRFLAAQLLLQSVDIEADSLPVVTPSTWLPQPSEALFTGLSPNIAVGTAVDEVLDWVDRGGHLILVPPSRDLGQVEELLEAIDLQLRRVERPDSEDDESDDSDTTEDTADDSADVHVDGEEYDYIVNLRQTYFRIDAPDHASTLSDDLGAVAARVGWGNGHITLFASDVYFSNFGLTENDHARLFLDAVAGPVLSEKVWIVYGTAFPSLWELLWTKARYVVVATVLLLLLILWSTMPRFGPRIPDRASSRRSLLEHIAAAGQFTLAQRSSSRLLRSTVAAVLHSAERHHPGISRLPAQQQAKLIAHIAGRSPQDVLDALNCGEPQKHREFTQQIQTLQDLRKSL